MYFSGRELGAPTYTLMSQPDLSLSQVLHWCCFFLLFFAFFAFFHSLFCWQRIFFQGLECEYVYLLCNSICEYVYLLCIYTYASSREFIRVFVSVEQRIHICATPTNTHMNSYTYEFSARRINVLLHVCAFCSSREFICV